MNVSEVSELLQTARRETALKPPSCGKDGIKVLHNLTTAVTRCDQALQFAEKALGEYDLKLPTEALKTAKEVAEQVMDPIEDWKVDDCQNAIDQIDKTTKTITDSVCDAYEYAWLSENLDEHGDPGELEQALIVIPEAKLWWIGKFGKKREVSWDDFWYALSDYMGFVYGYPVCETHPLWDSMQVGIQSCLGKVDWEKSTKFWRQNEDITISMTDFKKLYQRFGPWEHLYVKTLTLCDPDGYPEDLFYPSERKTLCNTYLSKARRRYAVRFSGTVCGCLVHHTHSKSVLIQNTSKGYSVETDDGVVSRGDVRQVLVDQFGAKDDEFWRVGVQELIAFDARMHNVVDSNDKKSSAIYGSISKSGNYGQINKNNYGTITKQDSAGSAMSAKLDTIINTVGSNADKLDQNAEKLDEHAGKLDGNAVKLDEIADNVQETKLEVLKVSKKIDALEERISDCHKDVIQFGLEALKKDETQVPRLFLIIPANYEELENDRKNKNIAVEEWHLHILCEGTKKRVYDGNDYFECHETGSEKDQYELKIPNQHLVKYLPCIRYGVQFTKLCVDVLSCEDLPGGSFVELVDNVVGVSKTLNSCKNALDNLSELYQETKKLESREIQNSYKLLRDLLAEYTDREDELLEGKCGSLRLVWNTIEKRPMWVCEEHRKHKHLTSLNTDQKQEYRLKPNPTIDPGRTGNLSVLCVKAIELPNMELIQSGSNKSDPYVKVYPYYVNGKRMKKHKTKRMNNTDEPVWDEQFTWHPLGYLIDKIKFEVWDHNFFRRDTIMGQCEITIHNECSTGSYSFNNSAILVDEDGKKVGVIYIVIDYEFKIAS